MRNILNVFSDGVEAMKYLCPEGDDSDVGRPDIMFPDINIPRKDGRQVFAEIKADKSLKDIPVVILTTADSEEDVERSYIAGQLLYHQARGHGLIYQGGHVDRRFWFAIVKLPPK